MKILITAGPTHEHLDPVRFIGNNSSGLQGIELAKLAYSSGNDVTLILGPTQLDVPYKGIKLIRVVSADEMFEKTKENFPNCDIAIFSAAVADYKPKTTSDKKIKRDGSDMTIELTPNRDIALEMGKLKTPKQVTIGFALETNDGYEHAMKKIEKKNFDFIILNETSKENPAFGSIYNQVTIIDRQGTQVHIEKTTKEEIAKSILTLV